MVDIKPLLQGFLWILASMAAALMVIHVRELFWPRQEIIINIPYGNRKLYARVKQVSKELESVQSSVREVRILTEASLLDHTRSSATATALGDYLEKESK